jgi:NAD(P)-dependent dehydrogenase (short-subunit alcohol dehydrogenase family)
MLTRSMAAELRPRGIIVVAITPGWVRTPMGGSPATPSVEESARSLATTITRLTAGDAGHFLDRDGHRGVAAW